MALYHCFKITAGASSSRNLFSKHGLLGVTTVGTMSGTNANDMLAFALREMLERNGALDEMKAQVRMLVIRCIDQCLPSSSNGGTAYQPSQSKMY
jgi:hypothetical protein